MRRESNRYENGLTDDVLKKDEVEMFLGYKHLKKRHKTSPFLYCHGVIHHLSVPMKSLLKSNREKWSFNTEYSLHLQSYFWCSRNPTTRLHLLATNDIGAGIISEI